MDSRQQVVQFNQFRDRCLRNADDLLAASRVSMDAGIDHASFHLSLLALEEIGKAALEFAALARRLHPQFAAFHTRPDLDDHERKIFFAVWGPSFGAKLQTKPFIEEHFRLAHTLHARRLTYLYADPANPQDWRTLMVPGEARRLHDLVTATLALERSRGPLHEEFTAPDDTFMWFVAASGDADNQKQIWSRASQEKLIELQDVSKWIRWLRDKYEEHEREMRMLAERELARQEPTDSEREQPKWRVKLAIVSPSHSIRQNNLEEFNKGVTWLKLSRRDANTLGMEITLPKNVPIHGVWEASYTMARLFAMALNIGTNGFLWWNIKRDPARFYEKIVDLESGTDVAVEISPRLEVSWRERHLVLRPSDVSVTGIVFAYLVECRANGNCEHLDGYALAMSILAKTDVHLRLEANAFELYFKALQSAMLLHGDWDGTSDMCVAYRGATAWRFPEPTDEMRRIFERAVAFLAKRLPSADLAAAYAMKFYCEVYLQTVAVRETNRRTGRDVSLVVHDVAPGGTTAQSDKEQ